VNSSRRSLIVLAVLAAALNPARLPAQPSARDCQVTVRDLEFGAYDNFSSTPVEAAGRITVRCEGPDATPVTISIGPGEHAAGFAPRKMRHGHLEDQLDYLIFTDASMSAIWGDGSRGSVPVVREAGPGAVLELPVFGRIPPGQDVSVGSFSDRLTVRVDW
jgi:spore coat protein U-like protein